MNRFAQLLHGEVIYIHETNKTIQELNQIFDPNTEWFDVTNEDVAIGYVQGIKDGRMVLVPKESGYSLQHLSEVNTNEN